MTMSELLEYIRVFATIKKHFAEKVGGQEIRVNAYADVISEVDRIESMFLTSKLKVTNPTAEETLEKFNQQRIQMGMAPVTPEEFAEDGKDVTSH